MFVRFDYWRWHGRRNLEHFQLEEVVFLLEADGGRIGSRAEPEGRAKPSVQVPLVSHRRNWKRRCSPSPKSVCPSPARMAGKRCAFGPAHTTTCDRISWRIAATSRAMGRASRRRSLDEPIVEAQEPPGYTVRAMGDGAELLERCYTSGLAFHPMIFRSRSRTGGCELVSQHSERAALTA